MDLGVVGLDGLVGGSVTTTTTSGFVTTIGSCSDPETKHKWYGSGFLKQERSEDDDLRSSKLAKTTDADNGDISASKAMLLRSNATLFSDSHHHQQHRQMMLSFSSSSKPAETPNFSVLDNKNSSPNTTLLPYAYHHHLLSSSYTRNTGCYSSSGSNSMVHGGYGGGRGPFTPSQWMELEHQALIYKYITANVPIPSNLLIPIRKALDSAGLYNFSTGLLRPNALGWGGFHLGFSNNNDPEPGRCRRTDGKKWRCSRDAVVDQKYCERHMNRGRHRSRKHVETGATTTTTTPPNGSKLNAASSSTTMVPGNSPTSSLTFAEPKNMHNLLAPNSNTSAANTTKRMFMNNNASEGMQDGPALPMLPPTLELKPKESHPFMIHKQEINPYDESSSSRSNNEFGLVTCDSLLNPSQKSSTLLGSRSYGSSQNPANRDTGSQHSLRHFIDDCPKTQSDHRSGSVSWPELDMQSDRTQLSISLPLTSSDFMSFTTSSPTNEKLTLSPLRLSRELNPIQMGLGVGSALNNESNTSSITTRQANWIPITWESSMGGPLGEVLNLSSNNYYNNAASDDHCAKNSSSALNLMSDGWDNSPPMGSSPTGVLQKTAFGSLSNSSAGSSPRGTDNKTQEVANSLCNDLLG